MSQKGFALILLLLIIAIAGIGSAGYYLYTKTTPSPNVESDKLGQSITISPSPNHLFIPSPIPKTSDVLTPKPKVLPAPPITKFSRDSSTINIKGDENCIVKTQEALNLLQNKAQIYYNTVIKYVGIIECASQGSGMYAWESPPRYQVGKATYEGGAIWYAGTIAHDSCHSKQYHDYLLNNDSASVPSETWTGKEAERQCLDVQYDALAKIGADQNTLDYVKNTINSGYWDVNYDNRWW